MVEWTPFDGAFGLRQPWRVDGRGVDILPMYRRHYTVEEYDAIQKQAIKDGKKKGFSFAQPTAMTCTPRSTRAARSDKPKAPS